MLRSLIVQLSGRRPDTPKPVQDLGHFRVVNQMLDMESLEKALLATIPDFQNVYLVLDAIDECPQDASERELLLELIIRTQGWGLDNLHVLLTSRKKQDIDDALKRLSMIPTFSRIDLERRREEVDKDIGAFID